MEELRARHSDIKAENNQELAEEVKESLRLIEDLKFFLATAPANWQENQVIRRYYLNHDEGFVSCVYWNNLYFITGTDIVRCIVYKFEHFGRKIIDRKKFEEGIFSDLRNLKCGTDAILESPRSEFLEFLFKNSCLRTQKKQKVFFWFNVPHDKLMADALERDLKKEKLGQNSTTVAQREPALSFQYDETKSLYSQLSDHMDAQKKLNGSPNDDFQSNLMSAAIQREKGSYELLARNTPQFKDGSDYEDDFPLDYFDNDIDVSGESNDYITLDPSIHQGSYNNLLDENYDSIVDPSVFTHPKVSASTSSQLIYNDEYLIEQTQQIKTPIAPVSAAALHRLQNRHPTNLMTSSAEEAYQTFSPVPLSAKFTNHKYQYPGISHNHSHTQQGHFHPLGDQGTIYTSHVDSPIVGINAYGYADQDFVSSAPSGYNGSMDQLISAPQVQPYMVMGDLEYFVPNHVYVNPSKMNALQNHHYAYPVSSTRQQQISANMMKKKRMMLQQQRQKVNYVSKNTIEKTQNTNKFGSAEELMRSKVTNLINYRRDDLKSDTTETLIPTPESSITNTSDQNISNTLSRGI
ncbi:uncharacterized protein PRCAT00001585001 [Priceomyces carsonii]|uniref:uncharacterized protein n=1 Tax=Priceomyces carsonii TaxID=28549 RepID=UPI002EDA5EB6|nr:unnamed protein product [Priceomyces carsonii]